MRNARRIAINFDKNKFFNDDCKIILTFSIKLKMLNYLNKFVLQSKNFTSLKLQIPAYTFILGRLFKKQQPENSKQNKQKKKIQEEHQALQKKRKMKQQQPQYDFLQRQKEIQLNKDFRKLSEKYKNTIPQHIGSSGFSELVYWSQNAQTPEQISSMIKKFNNCSLIKAFEDQKSFLQFKQNVKATVYLASNYQTILDYAYFGYKYRIEEPEFWLKIEQKCERRHPQTNEQYSGLIDILFVMANVGQGEVLFSSSQKILSNRQFTVQQIAKLLIAYFKTSKGQKQWVTQILASLQKQIHLASCDVLESILSVLKQSKSIPPTFDQKVQKRLFQLEEQLSHSLICVASQYFGFEKGSAEFWIMIEKKARVHFSEIKKIKGRITSQFLEQIITGILVSYRFSTEYVLQLVVPELEVKNFQILRKLSAEVLSTLSKTLYIYELQQKTKSIQFMIQNLIMNKFEKIPQVPNRELVKVLKNYTVTRLGSREFYLFLEQIVIDKIANIRTEKYTIDQLITIYEESHLCSMETLSLLKAISYQ